MNYLNLAVAIVSEVVATSALTASGGFSKPLPTVVSLSGYLVAFYFLSVIVETMPVGVVYAIWSGVGIALLALVSVFWFGHSFDPPAIIGIAFIIVGVVILNLWSKTLAH